MIDILDSLFTLLAWGVIWYFAYRIYKKQEERPKIWKLIIVLLVGIFSFSITIPIFHTNIQIALLPLGVWILFAIFKNKEQRWNKYRKYAWLGFFGNYIFLLSLLLTFFIHSLIYNQNSINTYIADISEAKIVTIHPSGKDNIYLRDDFMESILKMEHGDFFARVNYDDMFIGELNERGQERFPYMLVNFKPMWGSGIKPNIYIEEDGKGILINTERESMYFRSDDKLLEEGERHE